MGHVLIHGGLDLLGITDITGHGKDLASGRSTHFLGGGLQLGETEGSKCSSIIVVVRSLISGEQYKQVKNECENVSKRNRKARLFFFDLG